jgi:hypothetical protein
MLGQAQPGQSIIGGLVEIWSVATNMVTKAAQIRMCGNSV